MSDSEFGEYNNDYQRRSKSMEINDSKLKSWQDFYTQLDEAGVKIRNTLIDGLTSLTGPLTKLSEGLSNAVKSLIDSGTFKTLIDSVASGISTFAQYIGTEKFKNDVKLFVDSIEMLATKIVAALRWLNLIPGGEGGKTNAEKRVDARKAANNSLWNGIMSQ
jgi:hypothetical protein